MRATVVGAGGRIALPGEEGREQRLRLEMEGVTFRGGRVRMDLHGWTPARDRTRRRPRVARAAVRPTHLGGEEMPVHDRPAEPERRLARVRTRRNRAGRSVDR